MIPAFPGVLEGADLAQKRAMMLLLPFLLRCMKGDTMTPIRWEHVEITSLNRQGFWLRLGEEELYLPFALFPWFEHATVAQLCRVECLHGACLVWPGLDLELALDRIRDPMAVAQMAGMDC